MPKLVYDNVPDEDRDYSAPEFDCKKTVTEVPLLRYSNVSSKRMVTPTTHKPAGTYGQPVQTMEDMGYIYMDPPIDRGVSGPYIKSNDKIENVTGGTIPVKMYDTSRFTPLTDELTAYLHERAFMSEGYFKFLRTNDTFDLLTGEILLEHTYVHAPLTPDHVPHIHVQNLRKDITNEDIIRGFLLGQNIVMTKTTECRLDGLRLEKGEIPLSFFDKDLSGMRKAFFLHFSIRVGYVKERIELPTKRRDPDQDFDYLYEVEGKCVVCTTKCEDSRQEALYREFELEEPKLFGQFMALVSDMNGQIPHPEEYHANLEKQLKKNKNFFDLDYAKMMELYDTRFDNLHHKRLAVNSVLKREGCLRMKNSEVYIKSVPNGDDVNFHAMVWHDGKFDTQRGNLKPFELLGDYDAGFDEDMEQLESSELAVVYALEKMHEIIENGDIMKEEDDGVETEDECTEESDEEEPSPAQRRIEGDD